MRKILKVLAIAVGAILALAVVTAVALVVLFDPNQYKGEIVRAVKERTGRDLKIEKKIGWSFFPRLGVEAGGVELSNAPGFGKEPFARIDAAGVRVELLPLFKRRLSVDTIYLDGLTLNLARNAAGRTNWDDLAAPAEKKKAPEEPAKALPLEAFAAGKLDIRRANVVWHDQASGSRYAVRDLSLATGAVHVNEPVDVKLSLQLEHGTPVQRTPFALSTRLTYATDRLALGNLAMTVADSRLTGSAEVRDLPRQPAYRFDLALDQLDLDKHLPPAPAKAAARPAEPATPIAIPLGLLRALNVQGKLAVGKLRAFGIRSEDIRVQVAAANGLIHLGPNSARLYGGRYSGRTTLDARGQQPQLKLDEQLEKIALGPFLKDAGLFDKFSGEAQLKVALTARGLDVDDVRRTLNGTVAVEARDGKIEGVNLPKLIAEARKLRDLARGKPVSVTAAPTDETAFSRLHATLKLTNGVAANDDLLLEGPVVRATGRGTADLVKETLNYRLSVTLAEGTERRGTTVPVNIGGTFAKPAFSVDFGEVLKEEAGKAIEKKLEKKLQERLRLKR